MIWVGDLAHLSVSVSVSVLGKLFPRHCVWVGWKSYLALVGHHSKQFILAPAGHCGYKNSSTLDATRHQLHRPRGTSHNLQLTTKALCRRSRKRQQTFKKDDNSKYFHLWRTTSTSTNKDACIIYIISKPGEGETHSHNGNTVLCLFTLNWGVLIINCNVLVWLQPTTFFVCNFLYFSLSCCQIKAKWQNIHIDNWWHAQNVTTIKSLNLLHYHYLPYLWLSICIYCRWLFLTKTAGMYITLGNSTDASQLSRDETYCWREGKQSQEWVYSDICTENCLTLTVLYRILLVWIFELLQWKIQLYSDVSGRNVWDCAGSDMVYTW